MILVLLGGIAFIFPLAVYCLILASLNRQRHPVMVSGTWDFAEVIFACSGFILFGGPCILSGLNRHWREYWLTGRSRALPEFGGAWWYFWIAIWGLYFVFVIAWAAFMLWRRRLVTSIYNIEEDTFYDGLGYCLDRLHIPWKRGNGMILLDFAAKPDKEDNWNEAPSTRSTISECTTVVVKIDSFPAMRHVSLRWPAHATQVRQEVEDELARILVGVHTENNPVGTWMLWLAAILFAVIVVTLMVLIGALFVLARR
ncbi:MAG: hypothetical protein KatS3mg105_2568 [Gemmatales bacterium]|nr:MAG: hypothetical protein KatS3mg105_2568 [Gemmatales bacterium]